MVLIPKVSDAVELHKFWLIVLGNFLFKIINKILVVKIVGVMGRLFLGINFVLLRVVRLRIALL